MSNHKNLLLLFADSVHWYEHTITLQPDETDGIDTFINAGDVNTNFGTDADIYLGHYLAWGVMDRCLIKFDLTTLPADAVITSATLSLYLTANYGANAQTFNVYRLKRNWVESEATWNIYSTGNSWIDAGGFNVLDCEQDLIGTKSIAAAATLNEFNAFSLTPITKAALDLGYGWLIKSAEEDNGMHIFSSSSKLTEANRPKLVIEYKDHTP